MPTDGREKWYSVVVDVWEYMPPPTPPPPASYMALAPPMAAKEPEALRDPTVDSDASVPAAEESERSMGGWFADIEVVVSRPYLANSTTS